MRFRLWIASLLALSLGVLLAVRLMPHRAEADSRFAGGCAALAISTAFTSGASVTTESFFPKAGSSSTVFFTTATQAGTVQVFRRDASGVWRSQGSTVNVTANTEDVQHLLYPAREFRLAYVNTNASAGSVTIEACDNAAGGAR